MSNRTSSCELGRHAGRRNVKYEVLMRKGRPDVLINNRTS